MLSGDFDGTAGANVKGAAEFAFQLLGSDTTGPKNLGFAIRQINNCRLDSHAARSSVKDKVNQLLKIVADVCGGGRAYLSEAIRGRSGNSPAELPEHREGNRVIGNPESHCVETPGNHERHTRASTEDKGQRSGPEARGKPFSKVRHGFRPVV